VRRSNAPRLIAALFPLLLSGCLVPQSKYDDAMAKLRAEQQEHLRAEGELARVQAMVARIDEILKKKEESLAAREGELAQTKLEVDKTASEREEAANLVEQLRGELGRVGDHLRDYSNKKKELEVALTDAEARSKKLERQEATVRDKVLVMRDLSYGLAEYVVEDKAVVIAVGAKPAVRLDAKGLFGKKGEVLPEAKTMLERIARAAGPRSAMRVQVVDRSEAEPKAEDRTARLANLTSALSSKGGLPRDRIDIVAPTPPAEGGTVYPTPVAPGAAPPAPPVAEAPKPEPPKTAAPAKPKALRWQDGPGSIELTFDVPIPA
jgi:hypothetical protein